MKQQFLFAIFLSFLSLSSNSETTVISGDFLNDLRRSPVVGGGFSLTTEDYKSVCFEKIEVSPPSYDLYYNFQLIEENWRETFFRKIKPDSSQARLTYSFLEQSIGEKGHSLHILATIQLKSYYAALNESQTQLSEPARLLLENQNITGFFDACGTYYIRTMSRYSTIYALFTLNETNTTSKEFQSNLERIFQSISMPSSEQLKIETYFQNKSLYIRLAGFGLGKEHIVSLAPTDLDSFKKILQNSTQAMAGNLTGRVEAIEIIPWMDNLNFQYFLNLNTNQEEDKQSHFWRKWIIAENSEFIAQLKNSYRELQEQYFMAVNCQAKLTRHLAREKAWKQTKFRNYQNKKTIMAAQLLIKLTSLTGQKTPWSLSQTEKPSKTLYQKWQEFTQQADECLAELEPEMTRTSYREISYCSDMITELVQIMPQILFDYCPPEVSNEEP